MKQTAALVFWAILVLILSEIPAQAQIAGRALQAGGYAVTAREGYRDAETGKAEGLKGAAIDAAIPAGAMAYTTGAAAAKGAGSLAGYAGVASAVSKLGLGGVTTTIAGAMGSSASGAAATAVVTSAVGGPLVMGGILICGSALAGYGLYKGGQAVWRYVKD